MSFFDLINGTCAIVQTGAMVVPIVKKAIAKRSSKQNARKRSARSEELDSEEEEEEENYDEFESRPARLRLGPVREDEVDSDEIKGLIQAVQKQSQLISHLMSEQEQNRDRSRSISESPRILALPALDDQTRPISIDTSLRHFSFPASDRHPRSVASSPTSRASSFSMPSPTLPPSPAISMSSTSSVSSFSLSKKDRHVSFGSPSLRASSYHTANSTKRTSVEINPERALSIPLPNKYQRSPVSRPSRAATLPSSASSQPPPLKMLPERALSFLSPNQYPPQPHESLSVSKAAPIPKPNPPSRINSEPSLPSSSSFSTQTKNRHQSLQPVQTAESPPKPSNIPPRDQWRSSLKTCKSPKIPFSLILNNASVCSSPRDIASAPMSRGSSISTMYLSSPTLTPKSKPTPSDTFYSLLSPTLLSKLTHHLEQISTAQLHHHTTTWSYAQTLDQLLNPDHFYFKGSDAIQRSYLSPSVRTYICALAYTLSARTSPKPVNPRHAHVSDDESEDESERKVKVKAEVKGEEKEKEKEKKIEERAKGEGEAEAFTLMLFLLRFVMFFGVDVLKDASTGQCSDPTGLREVESSYEMAREILGVLEGNT